MKNKTKWPIDENYKGYELWVFHDGSVSIDEGKKPRTCFKTLQETFDYIDKAEYIKGPKNNMFATANTISKDWIIDECVSFAPCSPQVCNSVPCAKPKGNNPMYVDNDKHIESSKINYLADRLSTSYYVQERKLPETFNLNTPKVPDTADALVAAITSGNYSVKPKAEQNPYDRAVNNIVWRNPTIVPDKAGYEAAMKTLEDMRQAAKDTIVVGTPADALTAIKAIDAWTPTVAAAPVATA